MKWLLRICATFLFVTFLITVLFHMPRSDVRSELVSRRKHKVVELREATVVKRSKKTNSDAAKKHDMAEVTQLEQAFNSPLKTVVILTYQRCGSSFLGRLFNLDPRVFYVFEPLDGLYSSMYGTSPGWNVPSNIITYKNGTERHIPSYEVAGVSTFLANLFSCDVGKLPTAYLRHSFWSYFRREMKSTNKYTACLYNVEQQNCYSYLRDGICASEFGRQSPANEERCYRLLNTEQCSCIDEKTREQLNNYTECHNEIRMRIDDECSPILSSACSSRLIRVVKLVRGTMESMEALLRLLPDTRVIHLFRDPRAVSLSRFKFDAGGRGLYSRLVRGRKEQIPREAKVYCRQLVADIRLGRLLERQFPGRFYSLTYEQLIANPVKQASDIYRFMGEPDVPPEVARNFSNLAKAWSKNETGKIVASKWRQQLTLDEQRRVDDHCAEFMELFPEFLNITDS